MINLMYVVLMALLALNVSTEVLDGFSVVEESLNRTTDNASRENKALYEDFRGQMERNPAKVKAWFDKATAVKDMSDSLYDLAQALKVAIVREADGDDGDVTDIKNREDLEAAAIVMLSPGSGRGRQLRDAIDSYRERVIAMVGDERAKKLIESNLSTQVPRKTLSSGKTWQEYMFENMPVAAAVTMLSKLQSDVRQAEGEALHTLVSNVDLKDIRVNKLDAFVIPEKTTLYPGESFNASIVMAAVDTTQQPEIYINNRRVNTRGGHYSFAVGGVGEHSFSGYMLLRNGSGDMLRRDFMQRYEVVAQPMGAIVAADLMNVLYAGFQNPVSVSVPGIPQNAVRLSMTGGSLVSEGNGHYVATPAAVGSDVTFTVSATDKGKPRNMGTYTFKVRKLPDPTPYLLVGSDRFKGGALSKGSLMSLDNVRAAIDDGLLDIEFRVVAFETVFYDNMGNAVPMASKGNRFTQNQKATFRKLSRNKRFYIKVTAVGPDGITRKLPGAMEVIVR